MSDLPPSPKNTISGTISLNKDIELNVVNNSSSKAATIGYSLTQNNSYSQNLATGYYQTLYPNTWNYYPWYTVSYQSEPVLDLKTRKVENGFIVLKSGKEYIFTNEKSLAKFIINSYKPQKTKK